MRKSIYIYTLIFTFSLLNESCIFMHYDDSESLGGDFYYLPDGKFSSILYDFNLENKSSRSEVIPPLVTNYNFNKKHIIAKTKDENQLIKYWILDKSSYRIENPLRGMDSISFYRELSNKNIALDFD